jgi:hypothetical protein
MCDGFFSQKNQSGCPNCLHQHPERKHPNARKFTRKKMVNRSARHLKMKFLRPNLIKNQKKGYSNVFSSFSDKKETPAKRFKL